MYLAAGCTDVSAAAEVLAESGSVYLFGSSHRYLINVLVALLYGYADLNALGMEASPSNSEASTPLSSIVSLERIISEHLSS